MPVSAVMAMSIVVAPIAMPFVIVPSVPMVPLAGVMTVAPLPISVGAVIGHCGERQRKHRPREHYCKQPNFRHANPPCSKSGTGAVPTVRLKLRVHAGGVAALKNP
jgi:hypothetical protein